MNNVLTNDTQIIYSLVSDKDLHFAESYDQWETEEENITGLVSSHIRITDILIESAQNLDYQVLLFRTDGFANANLDRDSFCASQELDLPSYGFRINGAGQYYIVINGLDIIYEDRDDTYELHVALQNLSATTKNAGATGAVILKFKYEALQSGLYIPGYNVWSVL